MADGPHHFNPNDSTNNAGKAGAGDASFSLINEVITTRGDNTTGKAGDNVVAQAQPGDAAATDPKGYNFSIADQTPAVRDRFAGTPQENLVASNEAIGSKVASLASSEDPSHMTAVQDWAKYFASKTPGFENSVKI